MTDQFSIQYISRLLDSPALITEVDRSSVGPLVQAYPYLVPLRYIEAAEKRTPHAFSPEMLARARPYLGNWIKYCDFADAASQTSVVIEPETIEYIYPVEEETQAIQPEQAIQLEHTDTIEEVAEPTPAILFAPEPVAEADAEDRIADEIAAEIKHETVPEPLEPVVKVSDEFLQLIREETPIIQEPAGVAPRPVFEAEEAPAVHNDATDEYEIEEEAISVAATPVAEPVIVALHVVEPIIEEPTEEIINNTAEETLISPIYTQDYFRQQGEKVSEEMPGEIEDLN